MSSQQRQRAHSQRVDRQRAETHTGQTTGRGAGPYPRNLEPVALEGDIVKLISQHLDEPVIRQVEAFEPQPTIVEFDSDDGDDITVSGNDSNTDHELTRLEVPDGWIGQFRMVRLGLDIPADIEITVDQGGSALPLYSTKNRQGRIDRATGTEIGHDDTGADQWIVEEDINTQLVEWYVWEQEPPIFSFENTTAGDVGVSDIRFSGYMYRTIPVNRVPDNVHPIPLPVGSIREGR